MKDWSSERLSSGAEDGSKAAEILRIVFEEIQNERGIRQARREEEPNPDWSGEMRARRNRKLAIALVVGALSAGAGAAVALICNNQGLEALMK